jgi:hypothetical protein
MEQFLSDSDADAVDLLRSAQFYEQYTALWSGLRGRRYRGIEQAGDEYLKALAANFSGESARTVRRVNQQGDTVGVVPDPPSNESRAAFLIHAVDDLKSPHAPQLTESIVTSLSAFWKGGAGDREDLVRLLDVLTKRGLKLADAPFVAARQLLLKRPETDNEFRAAAEFCEKYPEAISSDERDTLRAEFADFASDHPLRTDDEPDMLRQVAADLEYVGERLGVATDKFTQGLLERADELESERAEQEPPDDDDGAWRSSDSYVDDVQAMFDGLQNDLKD